MNYRDLTALITGASGGRREEFARQLAERGTEMVLVARSEDKLERLAKELRQHAGVKVNVTPADLSSSDSVDHLISEVKNRGLKISLLVNNAGLGVFENFLETSRAKQMKQVDVNVRAVVSLAHAFLPDMIASRRGGLINRPVVTEILRAFERRKTVVYPGKIIGRLSTWGARRMPRNLILRLAAGTVKRLHQK